MKTILNQWHTHAKVLEKYPKMQYRAYFFPHEDKGFVLDRFSPRFIFLFFISLGFVQDEFSIRGIVLDRFCPRWVSS